ncbi:iron complex outermembrane receptor protein [Sphingomonas sp. MM-1]|uniref:TonB-dependent receptor n=1 Tax=Sphingomonas sp. MM-1 TaxID=745310 RepID=UPI0002C10614|nr:TonB-dependent receptor [Sphingomonas sp. MM-1]AGH50370.1 iron complex outermembrane receptor protein [Sphingomonas sp. MM-1]
MASSDFRSSVATPAFIALGCVGFIASAPAMAQSGGTAEGGKLGGVTVEAEAIEEGIKVDRVESPKATAPLLDTPQTITVVSAETLRQQNLLTLRDALSTLPGITFGAGEGGGGFGDSINLRGYSANNDILYDGVRDSAQYSRTETFNIQQIEVYNGANSVFNGSGSIGGSINLVQKTPQAGDLTTVSAGIGTDNYYRATVDSNVRVSDLVAVRLNAVIHENDYPGRDVEKNKRWGIAPSVKIGAEGPTSLTLSYLYQRDNNIPVYGVPYYRNAVNDGPLDGIKDSSYFGIRNLDDQDIYLNQATMRFDHAFSDKVSIRNLTRWQRVEQNTVTSAPQGTWCLADGTLPTGLPCTGATNQPGFFYPSGPRGFVRDQENELYYNQTDLKADFLTGPLHHSFVIGVAYTREDYHMDTGQLLRDAAGNTIPQPPISITNPNTVYTGPVNYIRSSQAYGSTTNKAIYAFDTIALVSQVELNLGARYENNKARFRTDTYNTTVGPNLGAYTRGANQVSDENLFSWRAGLTYKPTEWASLYVAYGNSRTPRSASVRAGCGTVIGLPTGGTADPCDVAPEKAFNYEIGAKAELFDRQLLLTAALFRNDRTNYSVNTNDPIAPTLPVQDGHSRVDGIALGASGNITREWAVFANYTYLDGEVRQSVSDYCLEHPGPIVGTPNTNPCGNNAAVLDPQRGQRLTNTPRHSGSLFTTYMLPFGLQVGYGFTYQGSFAFNNSALVTPLVAGSTALTPVFKSKSYLVHRAFFGYEVMEGMQLQLNIQNFTDKRYFTGIRNNGWATPGEGRSARFTINYSF